MYCDCTMRDTTKRVDRRSVLKATGAALGATAVMATGVSTVSATQLCLKHDWVTYRDCPPTDYGDTVEKGTMAYEACTDEDGTQYYWVFDGNGSGYVTEDALEPC